jgi:hypothetical protein
MHVSIATSIDALGSVEWNRVFPCELEDWSYYRAVETAGPPDFSWLYFGVSIDGKLVAAAAAAIRPEWAHEHRRHRRRRDAPSRETYRVRSGKGLQQQKKRLGSTLLANGLCYRHLNRFIDRGLAAIESLPRLDLGDAELVSLGAAHSA